MLKKILIIQGNPDPEEKHFGHALAIAYAKGAESAGFKVNVINVASLDFPLLKTKDDFENSSAPLIIQKAQDEIREADHLVIFYPLWLGDMPAILKAFFEQVFRPGFGFASQQGKMPVKLLKGKSARIIVTMGMPAFLYKWFFFAHSLRSLKRNILRFCGVAPIKDNVIGMIETPDSKQRARWLHRMTYLGSNGI